MANVDIEMRSENNGDAIAKLKASRKLITDRWIRTLNHKLSSNLVNISVKKTWQGAGYINEHRLASLWFGWIVIEVEY